MPLDKSVLGTDLADSVWCFVPGLSWTPTTVSKKPGPHHNSHPLTSLRLSFHSSLSLCRIKCNVLILVGFSQLTQWCYMLLCVLVDWWTVCCVFALHLTFMTLTEKENPGQYESNDLIQESVLITSSYESLPYKKHILGQNGNKWAINISYLSSSLTKYSKLMFFGLKGLIYFIIWLFFPSCHTPAHVPL